MRGGVASGELVLLRMAVIMQVWRIVVPRLGLYFKKSPIEPGVVESTKFQSLFCFVFSRAVFECSIYTRASKATEIDFATTVHPDL